MYRAATASVRLASRCADAGDVPGVDAAARAWYRLPMPTRALSVLLSVAALGVACENGAGAEPPVRRAAAFRSDAVEADLERAAAVVRTRGFTDLGDTPWRGFLVDRGAAVDEVRMGHGSCYVVVAAVSPAMRDLSIALYDSDGGEVAQSAPGTRALRYCPPQTGTYFVALRAEGSGLFAVRRFEGPTGLDVRLDDLVGEARP